MKSLYLALISVVLALTTGMVVADPGPTSASHLPAATSAAPDFYVSFLMLEAQVDDAKAMDEKLAVLAAKPGASADLQKAVFSAGPFSVILSASVVAPNGVQVPVKATREVNDLVGGPDRLLSGVSSLVSVANLGSNQAGLNAPVDLSWIDGSGHLQSWSTRNERTVTLGQPELVGYEIVPSGDGKTFTAHVLIVTVRPADGVTT